MDHISANNVTDIQSVLSDEATLSDIAQAAENRFVSALTAAEDEDSAGTSAVVDSDPLARSAARATQLLQLIDQVCDGSVTDLSVTALSQCGRSVEVLVKKMVEEFDEASNSTTDDSIGNAISLLTGPGCDTLLTVLGTDNFDLSALQADDFTSCAAAAAAGAIAADATRFTNLAGMSLRVNDPDNTVPAENKHGRLELYFEADASGTGGPLTACIRYIDGVGASDPNRVTDDDLENGDTRGSHVSGNWQVLGNSGYSVVLNLSITSGSTPYTAIVKSAGSNGNGQQVFRFDFDGGLEDWVSVNGLVNAPSEIPSTSEACRTRFNTVSDS